MYVANFWRLILVHTKIAAVTPCDRVYLFLIPQGVTDLVIHNPLLFTNKVSSLFLSRHLGLSFNLRGEFPKESRVGIGVKSISKL